MELSRIVSDSAFVAAFWRLTGLYWGYIIAFALVLVLIRWALHVPDFIFRKLLHVVAFTSILPLMLGSDDWHLSVMVQICFLIVVILALLLAERLPFYSELLVEKGKHEILVSFIMLFSLIAVLIAVFWGWLGDGHKYIAIASIMAWGPGDAAAAIVGRLFGRHKLTGRWVEGVKSVEGTAAMAVTSFLSTLVTLMVLSGLPFGTMLILSLIIAPIAAFVELNTKHGLDTITVPIAASLVFLIAMNFIP